MNKERFAGGDRRERAIDGQKAVEVVTLSESLRSPYPPRESIVEHLIDRGEIVVLAATPGTGKTPLVTQLVSCVAAGVPFLDHKTLPGKVIHIDMESRPDRLFPSLERQWAALGGEHVRAAAGVNLISFVNGLPADPNSQDLKRIFRSDHGARWEWVSQLVTRELPTLVVIDTVLTFTPFKSSDEARVRDMFAGLMAMRDGPSRPGILLTVHLRKRDRRAKLPRLADDPFGWTEEILGTIVWSASADVRLGLERMPDDRVTLAGFRRGIGAVGPFVIQAVADEDGEPMLWQQCTSDALLTHLLTPALAKQFARVPLGVTCSWSELRRLLGCSTSTLNRMKDDAIAEGLLERVDGGQYRRVR